MQYGDSTIPVRITNVTEMMPSPIESRNIGRSTWTTWTLAGTENPFALIGQDEKRVVTQILIQGAAGGSVFFGTREQVQNKGGGQIFAALVPSPTPYVGSTSVWCNPNGLVGVITVLDERGI
jgi:hypothetical protein